MSKLVRIICPAILIAMAVIPPASIVAQSQSGRNPIATAQSLINAAFNELNRANPRVNLSLPVEFRSDWNATGAVFVEIESPDGTIERGQPTSIEDLEKRFLRGHVDTAADGRLERAQFSGAYIHSRENRLLTEQAANHPEWTDDDFLSAARKTGVKYAPADQDEFTRNLNLRRFERVLGTLTNSHVTFFWRRKSDDPETSPLLLPGWRVKYMSRRSDGRAACYWMDFEPFEGRLTSVDGRFCR